MFLTHVSLNLFVTLKANVILSGTQHCVYDGSIAETYGIFKTFIQMLVIYSNSMSHQYETFLRVFHAKPFDSSVYACGLG